MAKRKTKASRPVAFIDDPLWYKDAVIYQVHVKSYFDSNNDGIGDFPGLARRQYDLAVAVLPVAAP
jgi:maltose alpha-D-glucosyltransferase/alpha-amylase